ncbi:hypothetical protein PR048_010660 [Dryococelus australis]|uniref:Uncharacterized protein n=1 Tax=Dryococelus australis TaxID=614101 RepID=A0ABQ9I3C1_9NEOP|nr:hypothetical protein PR048_010660 [Dryococelus australis]
MRESISTEERLIVTLVFLVTGRSYEDLKFSSTNSPQLLGKIIPETCLAIFDVLQQVYLCLLLVTLAGSGVCVVGKMKEFIENGTIMFVR